VKQILSREEVAALIQGMAEEEAASQEPEPGPAAERRGREGPGGTEARQVGGRRYPVAPPR
jgi:hypothetical protein